MVLYKISDRYPNYRDIYFEGSDLKGMSVHSAQDQLVGQVCELLIDDSDRLKYLVVNLESQTQNPIQDQKKQQKQVLLPIRNCFRTTDSNVLHARDLSSDEINQLTVYSEDTREAASASDDLSFLLYEERLSTRKQRVKTGEVRISKRVITDTTETATPVKKEKIVIEIESIYGGDTKIDVDEAEVAEDGSISLGIYEERTEVCRQVKPYQNVSVRKEVVEDVVKTQETLRREELSVAPEGLSYVDWIEE